MAKITVEIEIPISREEIIKNPEWFQGSYDSEIVIDNAYLNLAEDDDSFYAFTLVKIED